MKTQHTTKRPETLNAAERKSLRSSDFGLPDSREFPMPDAAHVHAAESYFRYASDKDKPALAHRIMLKGRKFGVDVESQTVRDWAARYK